MEIIEAKILLKNLLKRIRPVDEDTFELNGTLTDDEVYALKLALSSLGTAESAISETAAVPAPAPAVAPVKSPTISDPQPALEEQSQVRNVPLDRSVFELPSAPSDRRLCLDFGTAMSKVTLVKDLTDERGYEDIEVLKLGIPGDQEEVSELMLISSVYINNDGVLWFGNMAVKYSQLEAQDGSRQRLDNIKRYLSEEGLDSTVSDRFNPTSISITYRDMVLAYLMFLTWAVSRNLADLNEPRNLKRRFAMPCFEVGKARDVSRALSSMLGKAQVLADTYYETLMNGIPLAEFMESLTLLRTQKNSYSFVDDYITEPLGVASSLLSWTEEMSSFQYLIMVIDVGAGTSDFSMFRIGYDSKKGTSTAVEVDNSSEGITEAGNYLDKLLKGLILKVAKVDSRDPHWINIHGQLELDLRNFKESLFRDGDVTIRLFNDEIITITLSQFLSLPQVEKFGDSLKECRDRILNRIDKSFIHGAPRNSVMLALTGGGASLPMVKELAAGTVRVDGKVLDLVQTKVFPNWLEEEYPELEDEYPRIAVSIGGARKRVISRGGTAKVTAGDIKSPLSLGGFYTKG